MTSNVLASAQRPVVSFDAYNNQHRQVALKFLRTNAWKDSPVQFKLEGNYVNVVDLIKQRLITFYAAREGI
jgi:hypothetical protein